MVSKIFVNLPVKNLAKSIEFFTKVGFTFNQEFTDNSGTCMIISEHIFAMLLTETRFKDFIKKPIIDAKNNVEVLLALEVQSREQVDEYVRKAVEAGGSIPMEKQDHGWMYAHSFQDPDGHVWEVFCMDEEARKKQMA